MKTIYDEDYFLAKWEAIPEDMWLVGSTGDSGGPRCVLGHTLNGQNVTEETTALYEIFNPLHSSPATVNNGNDNRFKQPTPKERVIAAAKFSKEQKLAEINVLIAQELVNTPAELYILQG